MVCYDVLGADTVPSMCVWVVETKRRDAPDDYGMAVVQGMLWFSITAVITKLVLATAHSVATRGM